jgi:hypothetical protein
LYGAGALVALINPLNRRIGDMVAGTIVARERHDARNMVLDIDAAADAFLAAHAGSAPSATLPAAATPAASNIQTSEYSITVNQATAPTASPIHAKRRCWPASTRKTWSCCTSS